jgi:lactoylglutathione lyase
VKPSPTPDLLHSSRGFPTPDSESPNDGFTLYFLGYDHSAGILSAEEKRAAATAREGILELTWNHGTEKDPEFKGYANGNSDPGRGFGHIAISVDDVGKTCERFERLGVQFKKKLSEGRMRHIAFILDPDGYWVEVREFLQRAVTLIE